MPESLMLPVFGVPRCARCRNNNNGGVMSAPLAAAPAPRLGVSDAIVEEDEEEEYEDEEEEYEDEEGGDDYGSGAESDGGGYGGVRRTASDPADVPQAFSHFSWVATDGRKLVVDLQVSQGQALSQPPRSRAACTCMARALMP
jgi:hypothetical protein